MKALGLDFSLAARKELATELGYPGDTNDSAKHERLAAPAGDGKARRQLRGKLPADIKH